MENQKKWFVLKTKPRSEKKVTGRLEALGIEVYCPLKKELRQWSDRKKKVEVPVLPSMVLVHLEENERHLVFNVPGVLSYLFWLGEPAVVRDREVDVLQETIKSGFKVLDVETISVGDTIEIDGIGTVKKETGKVKYISGNQCWIILDSLGYVVKMNI
mgnify:CR=1 FL=1